jgi:hypothetical protein
MTLLVRTQAAHGHYVYWGSQVRLAQRFGLSHTVGVRLEGAGDSTYVGRTMRRYLAQLAGLTQGSRQWCIVWTRLGEAWYNLDWPRSGPVQTVVFLETVENVRSTAVGEVGTIRATGYPGTQE